MSKQTRTLVFLLFLFALPLTQGCFDFSGKLRRDHERLLETRQQLEDEIKRMAPLFNERDRLRQQMSNLQAQKEQLQHIKRMREAEKK